jgi:glycosyltransferase involved in cell wall biosynthesis
MRALGGEPRRVLWVTDEPPDRALGGGSIRQSHLLEALATELPTDLLVVGADPEERVRAAVSEVIALPRRQAPWTDHPGGRRALSLAIALGSRYPSPIYPTRGVRRDVARAVGERRGRYGLVCVEHEALAPLLPATRSERWMITLHHLISGMIESELALAPGRRQRWFRERDLGKAKSLERDTVLDYDCCIVCSDEDAAVLSAIGGSRAPNPISVIPNGVDLGMLRPTPVPPAPRVLLPGHLAWQPNVDGAVWFCSEVWPRVLAAVPAATLMLVGRSPADEVLDLGRIAGVGVHADVPSMAPYFESARVVVVPLRIGTGTRLKALEGMAASRPVVGTSIGLGGIGVLDGLQARVADDAGAFAAALVDVMRDDELAESLAQAGRAHVESRYGWDRIGDQFVALVSELLDRGPPEALATRSSRSAAYSLPIRDHE